MIALIDSDIIVYSVGFFNDITYYTVAGSGHHKYKKDAVAAAVLDNTPLVEIVKHHEANDIQKSLDGIDWMMKDILSSVGTDDYIPYLTGKGNYRETVAVTAPYKGNRKENAKPFWFKEMREYLVAAYDAIVVEGMEADDAMGIRQCLDAEEDTVICSIDKDMRMIPGKHYNWKKNIADIVTQEEGDRNFWMQMLTGDATDNIIGIKGIGPKTAEKLLPKHLSYHQQAGVIHAEYTKAFGSSWRDRYEENYHLLYICKTEDDVIR